MKAHESAPRAVAGGRADVGLGLASTASALGLQFVSLGHERVRVLGAPARLDKPGVEALRTALADGTVESLADGLDGYDAERR